MPFSSFSIQHFANSNVNHLNNFLLGRTGMKTIDLTFIPFFKSMNSARSHWPSVFFLSFNTLYSFIVTFLDDLPFSLCRNKERTTSGLFYIVSVPLPVRAPAFSPHWSPSTGNWAACQVWVSVRPLFHFLSRLQHSRLTGRPLQETGQHAQLG